MKAEGSVAEAAHAGLVAEDRAAAARRGRVDGEHGDLVALGDEVQPELIDQGRLAGAGRAADADADGVAGRGQETLEQGAGARLVLGLGAFDQGDGAGERHPVAGADRLSGPLGVLPRFGLALHEHAGRGKHARTQDRCERSLG